MLFGFAAAKLANYLDITKIYINVFDFIRQFLFILQTEPQHSTPILHHRPILFLKMFCFRNKKNIKRIKLSLANYVIMTKETDNSCILTNKTSLL